MSFVLKARDLKRYDHAVTPHFVELQPDQTVDVLLDPMAWQHIAVKVNAGDVVHVRRVDLSYEARLLVLYSTSQSVKCCLSWEKDYSKDLAALDDTGKLSLFTISWKGPKGKYAIVHKERNEVAQDGFTTKEEAQEFLVKNIEKFAR